MVSIKNYVLTACGLMLVLSYSSTASTETSPVPVSSPGASRAFPYETLELWQERSFVGNTRYELYNDNGVNVLKAQANNTASVLYREEKIILAKTPWLEWSWKIESIYDNIDEATKAGDDFPARLYVTAQTGVLPWEIVAINYVWSSNQPKDTIWVNPHTKKSIMVSVQSGESLVGHWTDQRRNIAQDFKQLFDIDVEQLSGYAVMVDGDNSSQSGTAYFGNIAFVAN